MNSKHQWGPFKKQVRLDRRRDWHANPTIRLEAVTHCEGSRAPACRSYARYGCLWLRRPSKASMGGLGRAALASKIAVSAKQIDKCCGLQQRLRSVFHAWRAFTACWFEAQAELETTDRYPVSGTDMLMLLQLSAEKPAESSSRPWFAARRSSATKSLLHSCVIHQICGGKPCLLIPPVLRIFGLR